MGLLSLIRAYRDAERKVEEDKHMIISVFLWSILGLALVYGTGLMTPFLAENVILQILISVVLSELIIIVIYVVALKRAIREFSISDKMSRIVYTTDIWVGITIFLNILLFILRGSFTFETAGLISALGAFLVPLVVKE